MIKLSDKKVDINEQFKTEELNINVLIVFEEKLRDSVINYSKKIIQESFTDINSSKLNDVSDSFLDISKALKKSEEILDTCNQLKTTFEKFRDDFETSSPAAQKTKVEDYNKKFNVLNKKINVDTNELQNFISNYEKNVILKEFLEKDNEVLTDIDVEEPFFGNNEESNEEFVVEPVETKVDTTPTTSNNSKQFDSLLEEYSKDTSASSSPTYSTLEPETNEEVSNNINNNFNNYTDTSIDISTNHEKNLLDEIDTIHDGEGFDEKLNEPDEEDQKDNYIRNIYEENLKREKGPDFTVVTDEDVPGIIGVPEKKEPEEEYNFTEKTLFISETQNQVTLPYTIEELKTKLEQNPTEYSSLEDVIKKDYSIPLNYYKSSAISRFREAYRLVRNRDHGSFKHALDLATELFFKSSLHPAIITACKNSDELDIYLSCLEFDELEDFKIFNIIYEIMPKAYKKRAKASI